MHPTFAAPRRARGARRARAMTRESPATASTSARAFLRGGAFERAVAPRSWPFLGLFAARADAAARAAAAQRKKVKNIE